ncbi:MAG: Sua5/YciO/YrdC/YwlC family protein [Myxococcales bacterium]|nr:Sua5/YciO/YrdC/YwlC family protein [Myxococcales bacterium]
MKNLEEAIAELRKGGVVCFPTESSYGLAVDPRSEKALAALSALKGRAANAPFALIAGSLEQARLCTGAWPRLADELSGQHWPGPLTLILPPRLGIGSACTGPSGGVGVRVSSVETARSLAIGLGFAITATSANLSGEAAANLCSEARAYFGEGVGSYLDGGRCEGRASTLVDFDAAGDAHVLREGPIVLLPPDAH